MQEVKILSPSDDNQAKKNLVIFEKMERILIVTFCFILNLALSLGVGIPCLDDDSQPVTTCQKCLWR